MRAFEDFRAVARLDISELARSQWPLVCIAVYATLLGGFVWVGMRESSVVGFTGMGRVLFSLCHALLLLLPLMALVVTGQVVNRAREDGALELLLSQPIRRGRYLAAITATRFAALALPLVVLLVGASALARGLGQEIPWSFVARASVLCTVLLWAFAALGIAISVHVSSAARAMTWLVVSWAVAVALLDFGLIGLLLAWRVEPYAVFALAALNPVECVRVALLAAAEPDLATLGPVGFYLSHRLGDARLLALGVGWPLAFGALVWALALHGFRRGDAV